MMYGSRDMEHNKQNFLLFWTFFGLYPLPPNNLKSQNFEKIKKKKKNA